MFTGRNRNQSLHDLPWFCTDGYNHSTFLLHHRDALQQQQQQQKQQQQPLLLLPSIPYHNSFLTPHPSTFQAAPTVMDQPLHYHAAAKSAKPTMAVLSGPTRSFTGWALIRLGKLSRAVRRFVILRSSNLTICTTENPRSAVLTFPVTGAVLTLTSTRFECQIRSASHRVWIQWASDSDLRVCRQAFEFANRSVDDYYKLVTHKQLGKGRNSEVVFAFDTSTGDHAAVKIINKDKARSTDREFAEKEVKIRMTIQHPCIVQTLDIFESPFDLFLVMELMNGGPLDRRLIKQNAPLQESEARVVMRRLFAALSHLHSRAIAHRNVKPQNIFLDVSDHARWSETAKLSDFSLACFLHDPDSTRQIVGTPEYLAPEASIMTRTHDGDREVVFGTEVDMWAAGVTLYNMLSLELPFEGEYPPDVFKKARTGKVQFSKKGFGNVSVEAISLIRSLLNVDRRKRPTADTVMLHPWFQKEYPSAIDDIASETRALSLSNKLSTTSESQFRFRAAVLAVRVVHRLATRTPGVHLKPIRIEKRFHFGVSGINIAPLNANIDPKGEGIPPRHSATVFSRISTGSTVKSRSSMGDSISSPPFPSSVSMDTRPPVGTQRSDRNHDYFSRSNSHATRQSSFGSGSMTGVQRLISGKIPQFGSHGVSGYEASENGPTKSGTWRWRRRSARESRATIQDR